MVEKLTCTGRPRPKLLIVSETKPMEDNGFAKKSIISLIEILEKTCFLLSENRSSSMETLCSRAFTICSLVQEL